MDQRQRPRSLRTASTPRTKSPAATSCRASGSSFTASLSLDRPFVIVAFGEPCLKMLGWSAPERSSRYCLKRRGSRRLYPFRCCSADLVVELVDQPTWPDNLCIQRSHPLGQLSIGGDYDHVTLVLRNGRDRVVARPRRMHDFDSVHVCFHCSCSGSSLQHDQNVWLEAAGGHCRPHSLGEDSRCTRPIAPPTGWARANHVGGVNHEHPT